MLYWERQEDRRYYRAWLQKDLLGSICVFKSYGSANTRTGKSECTVCTDIHQAQKVLRDIFKINKKQGYCLFPDYQHPSLRNFTPPPSKQKLKKREDHQDLFSMA